MPTVFIVSDATGDTAERVVRSALTQFDDAGVELVRRSDVRTARQVRNVVEEAAGRKCFIVHTLVSNDLRRLMLTESRLHGLDSLDVLGPALDRLATHLKLTPQEKPGLFQQLQEARSREIEAVEFAFHHDDGQRADELDRAEVVLVGVSRTMKTPTMLYLAYRGWFAANVPIVPEIELPPALSAVPRSRVFCLLMSPGRLQELRRFRASEKGIPVDPYASMENIRNELHCAREVCRKRGWRSIDVTSKSVEEVCLEIIALLPRRPDAAEAAE
jgi:regulator of PEP synthase PpsR (kinase-PPPase family)